MIGMLVGDQNGFNFVYTAACRGKGRAKGAFNVFLSVFIEAAIVFFVGYVFVYGGWKLTVNATNVSSVMRIPFKLLYSILPISGIFIILARVLKYVQLFLDSKEKKGENA